MTLSNFMHNFSKAKDVHKNWALCRINGQAQWDTKS